MDKFKLNKTLKSRMQEIRTYGFVRVLSTTNLLVEG